MSVARERLSLLLIRLPNTSSILRLTEPEPFFKTWENASYSPCTSVRKFSVPLGRFNIDWRLIISVDAAAIVGYKSDNLSRYLFSSSFIHSPPAGITSNSYSPTTSPISYMPGAFPARNFPASTAPFANTLLEYAVCLNSITSSVPAKITS